MESFSDNVTQAEICRKHGIYPVQLSRWREQFIQGGKSALAQRRNSDARDEEIEDLKKIIGDQSVLFLTGLSLRIQRPETLLNPCWMISLRKS